ncbi:sensor histidine kinase N-terminal domain-containing protein [Vibrio mimicus]|uniref:sensor histidine kinase n=1 Tax=Vibrio mimicus TaxID=674 RepID=UPI00050C1100|nr:sensor histidine kinase [Vibrio mimicus]MBY7675563.1 sensor histidine kinase N-terminal domain-containing protein [Vibrio mimicus]MBY7727550.1 sensor histidine kinase N-terminal domain-containing protein [Vibrio mimicus]TXY31090.1 two-component sensor histidine kinase [Vibrio mimicus]TXZ75485.1 two-component sensor histidine kinase [Vibrio mimicus]
MLISLYFSYTNAKHEVAEVYDARLGQSAKLLLMATSVSGKALAAQDQRKHFDQWMENIQRLSKANDDVATLFGHPYEQYFLFQFYRDGKLLFSSDAHLPPLSSDKEAMGFFDINLNGERWRYFQLSQPEGYNDEYVLVAEKQSIRDEAVNEIASSTALPQLILIFCLIVVLIVLIERSFQPIQSLQSAIAIRSVHKLDRIYVEEPTVELSPLVETLNQLLSELEQAWEREKRFTRMAAHELKTPLTVLRLNAENALRSTNPEQLKHDLDRILKGIERTDRLIHQLLMLAKVESTQTLAKQPVDLAHVIKQVIADLAPIAFKQDQQLSFSGESPRLWGDELLLGILFKNLLDNAIRYSGHASQIEVQLSYHDDEIEVQVSDTGVPIDDLTREKMFENFYRANSQKGDGAGLGMSICRDIAALHGGQVMLLPRSDERNTLVVRFRDIE